MDISDYRHGIIHGYFIPFENSAMFLRNPLWGNIQRSRPSTTSHVDENLLDLALDCVLTLFEFVMILNKFKGADSVDDELIAFNKDILRCSSQAHELRHLAALMNHEKY